MNNSKVKIAIVHLSILIVGILVGFYIGFEMRDGQSKSTEKRRDIVFENSSDHGEIEETQESLDFSYNESIKDNKGESIIAIPQFDGVSFGYRIKKLPYTPRVLNETYRELFRDYDDSSGKWNGLRFTGVEIDRKDKKAKIFLSGNWHPSGDMSGIIMRILVDSAAFYYPQIDKVKVFLDGDDFDWCMDDMSDEESGCSEQAKYWEDTRNDYNKLKKIF